MYIVVWHVTLLLDPLIKWKGHQVSHKKESLQFFFDWKSVSFYSTWKVEATSWAHACLIRLGVSSNQTTKSPIYLANWAKIRAGLLPIKRKRNRSITIYKKRPNWAFRLCLGSDESLNLLEFLAYFWYYSWVLLQFLVLFMGLTILFN